MEILQLRYFCDAAETENFTKTAKKHFVPTSNISQSIKRLENELGCELFEHRSNKITLNNMGRQFYTNVSEALVLLDSAKERILKKENGLHGDIHLACMCNRRIVTNTIEAFLQKYPDVNFIIHHSLDTEQLLDIIISDTCPFEYSKKLLIVDEPLCAAMNTKHPLAGRRDFLLSELENERFITMTPNSSLHKITVNICADAGFVPNIAIQTDDPFYLRRYIEMGLGIAFVPSVSWNGLFSNDVILKKLNCVRRKTYAFLPKRKYITSSVETFLQLLQNEASKQNVY